jgi:hypothetical protein
MQRNIHVDRAVYYGEQCSTAQLAGILVQILIAVWLFSSERVVRELSMERRGRAILIAASVGYVLMAIIFFERYPTIIFVAGMILGAVLAGAFLISILGGHDHKK